MVQMLHPASSIASLAIQVPGQPPGPILDCSWNPAFKKYLLPGPQSMEATILGEAAHSRVSATSAPPRRWMPPSANPKARPGSKYQVTPLCCVCCQRWQFCSTALLAPQAQTSSLKFAGQLQKTRRTTKQKARSRMLPIPGPSGYPSEQHQAWASRVALRCSSEEDGVLAERLQVLRAGRRLVDLVVVHGPADEGLQRRLLTYSGEWGPICATVHRRSAQKRGECEQHCQQHGPTSPAL